MAIIHVLFEVKSRKAVNKCVKTPCAPSKCVPKGRFVCPIDKHNFYFLFNFYSTHRIYTLITTINETEQSCKKIYHNYLCLLPHKSLLSSISVGKATELVFFTKKTDKGLTDKSSTHRMWDVAWWGKNDTLSGAVVHYCRPVLLNRSNLVNMQGAVTGWLKARHARVSTSGVEMELSGWWLGIELSTVFWS